MLTDKQRAMLEPLIEACRPKGKTPPQDLRRTLSAIFWQHQNGAKWRSVPSELGPWSRAAQTFSSAGLVWVSGSAFAPGAGARPPTRDDLPRRNQHTGASERGRGSAKRGSPVERDEREALGRSRGGLKLHGRPLARSRSRLDQVLRSRATRTQTGQHHAGGEGHKRQLRA
jgi:transposase